MQFCFCLLGVDEFWDENDWFLDLLINFWFLMRRKAKNNKTKLNWHKRRPGSLGENHPIIPQFIYPA